MRTCFINFVRSLLFAFSYFHDDIGDTANTLTFLSYSRKKNKGKCVFVFTVIYGFLNTELQIVYRYVSTLEIYLSAHCGRREKIMQSGQYVNT